MYGDRSVVVRVNFIPPNGFHKQFHFIAPAARRPRLRYLCSATPRTMIHAVLICKGIWLGRMLSD